MNKFLFLSLFLLSVHGLFAAKTLVSNASQINTNAWSAGDTLVMKNGTWTNQKIVLKGNGMPDLPIVLIAQTPGLVVLNGTSSISMSGSYLVVSGLFFKNGTLSGSEVVSFRTSSTEFADHCRLTNSAIVNYNPADPLVDSKWVSLFGTNNQVDHCSFEYKTNMGTLMVVWLTMGTIPRHVISQNYFGYRNANVDSTGAQLNGQEIIRLGDSSTSMQVANVTVQGNFFEKCNGEIEVISTKSCENLLTGNLFLECQGMLTLRHGNGTTVEGNWFFGNGVSATGGVRIIGENHKVYNNYFEHLRGSGYRAALSMIRGKLNSAPNEYFQVKNAVVAFNTMVDCTQAFSINYNSGSSYTMPPIGSTITHNHVYNTSSSNTNVSVDQVDPAMDITWENNLMNQGNYTNFSPTTSQIIKGKDPKMVAVSTPIAMLEPGVTSVLATYATAAVADVSLDIRGRLRNNVKIPGASQLTGVTSREMPTRLTTGASFYGSQTAVRSVTIKPICTIKMHSKHIVATVQCAGVLSVFNLDGGLECNYTLNEGNHPLPFCKPGIFLIRFIAGNGEKYTQKVNLN